MSGRAEGRTVTVRAPGKINVALRVGELMDERYHEIATAYQAVSLYEDVRASEADDFTASFAGPIDSAGVPTGNENLAIRAARLLARETGYEGGVHLHITKNVPIAGGMGGGSADAAAALVACDALWQTGCTREDLLALASRLGADVPFAIIGGTAIGTGRGDQLSPALSTGSFDWVLAVSETGMSTPDTYRALDAHRERHRADIAPANSAPSVPENVLHSLRSGDAVALADALTNDLQAAALYLRPELVQTLEIGEQNGALAGIVSGSGPTVAFLVDGVEAAIDLQVTLSAAGSRALRVTGPVPGARILES